MNNRQEQIEQARRLIATGISKKLVGVLQSMFPELKESEDERIRKELWDYFHDLQLRSDADFSPSFTIDDILAYLERQKEQKPAEWSEEDERMLKQLLIHLEGEEWGRNHEELKNLHKWQDWLKALPERFNLQPKQEWSEEDGKMLTNIISGLEATKQLIYAHEELGKAQMQERIDWLKSLRTQPHWKPSKEQIDALERAIVKMHTPNDIGILVELRDNLKKL